MGFHDYYSDRDRINPAAWVAQHELRKTNLRDPCWDLGVHVGVPPASGLLCLEYTRSPVQTIASVYRVEGQSLKNVWMGIVATWANWLDLTPVVSDDGTVLDLRDQSPCACFSALREHHEKVMAGIDWGFGDVLARGCTSVGIYEWAQGRYVKRAAKDAGARPFEDCY
jgi:hypothetical protein